MNKKRKAANDLMPGDIFHPGEYIRDELKAREMNQQELADKMGVGKAEISHLVNGRRDINAKTAVLLEHALGIDAEFWMSLQIRFDINLVKMKFQKAIRQSKVSKGKKDKFSRLVVNLE